MTISRCSGRTNPVSSTRFHQPRASRKLLEPTWAGLAGLPTSIMTGSGISGWLMGTSTRSRRIISSRSRCYSIRRGNSRLSFTILPCRTIPTGEAPRATSITMAGWMWWCCRSPASPYFSKIRRQTPTRGSVSRCMERGSNRECYREQRADRILRGKRSSIQFVTAGVICRATIRDCILDWVPARRRSRNHQMAIRNGTSCERADGKPVRHRRRAAVITP